MGFSAKPTLHLFCQHNAAAHDHHIDVVRGSFQENIAHVTAHHIAFHAQVVGSLANQMKDVLIEYLCQFGIGV